MVMVSHQNPGMGSPAIYRISVRGSLPEHWVDWFNGTIIAIENNFEGKAQTMMKCKVRDQAELFGILNRLNNLNMPLLETIFIRNLERQEELKRDKQEGF